MNFYIDIYRAIGSDGKAVSYCPIVQWEIDDQDNIDCKVLDGLKNKIQKQLDEGLNLACQNKRVDDKLKAILS